MTARRVKNLPASVRQRLLDLARLKGEAFHFVAEQYALERFLYRLSVSAHAQQFLLKGALLFRLWYDQPHRRTRDADLLGFGPAEVASLEKVFREVCEVFAEDGIRYLQESVNGKARSKTKCNIIGRECCYGKNVQAIEHRRTDDDPNATGDGNQACSHRNGVGSFCFDTFA